MGCCTSLLYQSLVVRGTSCPREQFGGSQYACGMSSGGNTARTSWRSWFWNVVLFALTLVMEAIVVAVAFQEIRRREPLGVVVFVGSSLWLGLLVVRALWVGVYARPHGIVMRGPGLTRTIPWDEVVEINGGAPTSGPSGAVGATTVVVMWRRPGASEAKPVELNAIGGYGLSPVHPTPAERAIVDLNTHLENWRRSQSVSPGPSQDGP